MLILKKSCESCLGFLEAAGALLAASFSQSLKIVVKHSRMTNQTHLLRQLLGARPYQCATPRTTNFVEGSFCSLRQVLILKINSVVQLALPD